MRKFQCLSFVLMRSYICYYIICMNVPLNKLNHKLMIQINKYRGAVLYHYCTTSFSKVWTQILRRFKPCSRCVGDLQWWESLTMVPAGNNQGANTFRQPTIPQNNSCIFWNIHDFIFVFRSFFLAGHVYVNCFWKVVFWCLFSES